MQLAISNIAWEASQDVQVYELMKKYGFIGLEIAPTRVISQNPYDHVTEAVSWKNQLKEKYGFSVPSMQSIWFARQEKLFGSVQERKILRSYTKKAIDFASAIECKNLVFGCPRNRYMPDDADRSSAIEFFKELGDYAAEKGTVIGMEANPTIYNTNFINDTRSAIELIKEVNSEGFRLNLDLGTMIQNHESISELEGNVELINHVHISEPMLAVIQQRKLHQKIGTLLNKKNYEGFVSVEMEKKGDKFEIERIMQYVKKALDKK